MAINRRTLVKAAAALPASSFLKVASAEEPLQLLKIILGYPPGGPLDVIARLLADKMSGSYARTVVVDNRVGASGMIGAKAVATAAPDGATMLLTASPVLTLLPHVYASISFDSLTDFAPVSNLCDFVHAIAIGPMVPESVLTLRDFLGWCKENPARANCAHPGEGSSPQFMTYILSRAAGVEIQPVAYKGPAAAMIDVVGGQIAAVMGPPDGAYLQYQKAGKIRVLAASGAERSPFFPSVPTFKESGYESMVLKEWLGAFMPARTPPAITERASSAIRAALTHMDVFDKLAAFAFVPAPSTPAELGKELKAHHAFWKSTVKRSGFKLL